MSFVITVAGIDKNTDYFEGFFGIGNDWGFAFFARVLGLKGNTNDTEGEKGRNSDIKSHGFTKIRE